MENIWIPVGSANTKREIKNILKDKRLANAKIRIRDMLKEAKPEHKDYLKMRFKSGYDKRYSVNVKPEYWS